MRDGDLAIGVDVGGTKVAAGLVALRDERAEVMLRARGPVDPATNAGGIASITAVIDEVVVDLAGREHDALRLLDIAMHDVNHGRDIDDIMIRMPAIKICHHRECGISDLGFAREFGFRHRGHADDRIARCFIRKTFGKA